jgi:hypothetical protein
MCGSGPGVRGRRLQEDQGALLAAAKCSSRCEDSHRVCENSGYRNTEDRFAKILRRLPRLIE